MVDDRQILRLIDQIYDAALDSRHWPTFIESLSLALKCRGGAILRKDRDSTDMGFIEFGGLDASARAAYLQYYSARSVWMPAAFRRSGELVIGHELAPDKSDFERSEFYNDWLRPQGVYDAIGGVIQRTQSSIAVVTVLREERAGLISAMEEHVFIRLMPHVRRAIDIHRRLYGMQLQQDGALRALDALNVGILLTDRSRRVIFANRVAEALLRRGDGLTMIRGQLRAVIPADTDRLSRLINGAVQTAVRRGEAAGGVLSLPTRAGGPVTVLVSPSPRFGLLEPAALVFVSEPRHGFHIEERHAAQKYGLTSAEARLSRALIDGKRLKEYAGTAGIAPNTAKSHLKQVFAKTGSKRQADLIRTVLTDPVLRLAGYQPMT